MTASPGVGKTHLAIALGVVTAELGHRLYFITATELARKLGTAFAQNCLGHAIKTLTQPSGLPSVRMPFFQRGRSSAITSSSPSSGSCP